MNKSELRKLYRTKRNALTALERRKLDDLLLIQFQKLGLFDMETLLSYCPSETHAEHNTYLMSDYLLYMIPGLQVCYPITNFETYGVKIDRQQIDVVFVPMLICDKQGYRVGFGKGFYDRFLPKCRPNVLKIGFSYFEPVDKVDDTHQFDVPLNLCITPQQVYECQTEV